MSTAAPTNTTATTTKPQGSTGYELGRPTGKCSLTGVDIPIGERTEVEEPAMMLRLGADHLLTLYTSGTYGLGQGGLFVVRIAKGQWRTVASWYTGC